MLVCVVAVFSLSITGSQGQTDPVRLISQTGRTDNLTAGRLEILIDNQWGTVCDNAFNLYDANAACRQLGFSRGAISYDNADNIGYMPATGPIWLDNLNCSSQSANLSTCGHSGIGTHNCTHEKDVILSCLTDGSLQLARYTFSASTVFFPSGRLEIFIGGRWGTVCNNSFSITSAQVVCEQLGFLRARNWMSLGSQSQFPFNIDAFADILLDNVNCSSSDLTLLSCPHNGVGVRNNCSHSQDVVVICDNLTPPWPIRVPVPDRAEILPPRTSNSSPDPESFPLIAIIGIAIGGAIFLLLLICIPIFVCVIVVTKRKMKKVAVLAISAAEANLSTPPSHPDYTLM